MKFLNCSYIMTVFQKVRCKRVAQSMAPSRFEDTCLKPRFLESFLYNRFVKMMPPLLSGDPINIMASRGKNPLLSPLFAGAGILSLQSVGQRHTTQAPLEVLLVLPLHSLEVFRSGSATAPGNIV